MGTNGYYSMFSLDGRHVGAAYTLQADQQAQGVPPNWGLYVAVENANAAAQRATELGGQLFCPPFDVAEHGRMAVIADPTKAIFSIWQPKQHSGVGVTGVDGTVCWADLSTSNTGAAKDFYSSLFGWQIKPGEHDSSGYLHIFNGDTGIGGITPAQMRDPQAPPHWMLYFLVSDCGAAFEKAKSLGANVIMPTSQIPNVGSMAILKDPQGAVFALFQPSTSSRA